MSMTSRAAVRTVLAIGNDVGLADEAPLRWAETDAERLRDVFVEIGGVAAARATLVQAGTVDDVTLELLRIRGQVEEVKRRGADVFFVIDVSRSMLAEDAAPSRLARAKDLVDETVESLGGDRVGLIEFAGTAAMRVPLTLNYGAFRTSLSELKALSGARGGTALANAIELAADSFPENSAGSRAIVILSDGEDLAGGAGTGDPVEAARTALKDRSVHVYAIGIGDAREGARIPVARTAEGVRYLVHEGQEVWTKLDERVLREASIAGEGAFIPAGTDRVEMARAYEQTVGALERQEYEGPTVTRRTPRFQWFAGASFALLLAAAVVPDRRAPKGGAR